jgi:putative transcriptional regulator
MRKLGITLRAWVAAAAVAGSIAGAPLKAQTIANGSLLVASPELTDANFARAVVLVLRHGDDGTVGVVLNRPTNLVPAETFPELKDGVGSYAGNLFRGGPIAPTRLVYLVRGLAAATVSGPEVLDKVFLSVDDASLPDMVRLADGTNDLRLYAGHVAWVPGQLQSEIGAGGWQVLRATAEIVFHADPGSLWMELEGRAGSGSDLVASATADAIVDREVDRGLVRLRR